MRAMHALGSFLLEPCAQATGWSIAWCESRNHPNSTPRGGKHSESPPHLCRLHKEFMRTSLEGGPGRRGDPSLWQWHRNETWVPKTSTLNEFRFLHLNDFSPCVCMLILIDSTCYNYRGMIWMLSFREMFWENNPIRSHGNPLRIRLNGHRTGHPNGLGGFQDAAETPPGAVGRTVVSHLPAISKEP